MENLHIYFDSQFVWIINPPEESTNFTDWWMVLYNPTIIYYYSMVQPHCTLGCGDFSYFKAQISWKFSHFGEHLVALSQVISKLSLFLFSESYFSRKLKIFVSTIVVWHIKRCIFSRFLKKDSIFELKCWNHLTQGYKMPNEIEYLKQIVAPYCTCILKQTNILKVKKSQTGTFQFLHFKTNVCKVGAMLRQAGNFERKKANFS